MTTRPDKRKRAENDAQSRKLAREKLQQEHREDLGLSDIGQIARLVGNRTLASLVWEAVK